MSPATRSRRLSPACPRAPSITTIRRRRSLSFFRPRVWLTNRPTSACPRAKLPEPFRTIPARRKPASNARSCV